MQVTIKAAEVDLQITAEKNENLILFCETYYVNRSCWQTEVCPVSHKNMYLLFDYFLKKSRIKPKEGILLYMILVNSTLNN